MEDLRDLARDRFGKSAERYVQSVDHMGGESLDRLIEVLAPRPEWRVLDVATGGGHTALRLAPLVREVVASDLTPEMLAAARVFFESRGVRNASFEVADAGALPFADESYDLVTCRIAPHHFPDAGLFVREAARVCRHGGCVAVIDNIVPDDRIADEYINRLEKTRDPSHSRAWTQREWLGFFEEAGLTVTHVERFRKTRDFNRWLAIQSIEGELKERLRRMFAEAPPQARDFLAPVFDGAAIRFVMTELMIVSRRAGASRP